MDNCNIDGYEKLAAAVVERAISDYRSALKRLKRKPHDLAAKRMKNDCERFFLDEITIYSNIDGKTIMRMVKEQVKSES